MRIYRLFVEQRTLIDFFNVVNIVENHKETLSANEEMGYEEMDF